MCHLIQILYVMHLRRRNKVHKLIVFAKFAFKANAICQEDNPIAGKITIQVFFSGFIPQNNVVKLKLAMNNLLKLN